MSGVPDSAVEWLKGQLNTALQERDELFAEAGRLRSRLAKAEEARAKAYRLLSNIYLPDGQGRTANEEWAVRALAALRPEGAEDGSWASSPVPSDGVTEDVADSRVAAARRQFRRMLHRDRVPDDHAIREALRAADALRPEGAEE